MRTLTILLCLGLASTSATDTHADGKPLVNRDRIDAALANLVEEHGLVGVSGLIYENGKEAYFGAYGFANREEKRPMRRDTLAYIYSMTKPITGVALMTLYDKGAFKLDDPLSKYAPEFDHLKVFAGKDEDGNPVYEKPIRPVTVRDVTRHTGGFANGPSDPDPVGRLFKEADPLNHDNTLTQMAEKLGNLPLLYQPGTRWYYGPSVDIQAFLVERISGVPFDEYVRKTILDPLGMDETRYYFGAEYDDRRTRIYERAPDGSFVPESLEEVEYNMAPRTLKRGGSGFISTVDNYMRFARMLLNEGELDGHRILKPETVRLMAANALPSTITDSIWLPTKGQMGFGIDFATRIASPATPDENSGEIGEFFWDGRASTLFWVDPENDIAAVLFAQFLPFNTVPAHKNFRDAIYHDDETAAAPRE